MHLEAGRQYIPLATKGYMGTVFGVAVEDGPVEVPLKRVVFSEIDCFKGDMEKAWAPDDGIENPRDSDDDGRTMSVRWDGPEHTSATFMMPSVACTKRISLLRSSCMPRSGGTRCGG